MNIAKLTEDYIKRHPSVKDCIIRGLINYSKLARLIADEETLGKKSFSAILIACRRYFYNIKKDSSREGKILDILEKSKVEIKNKIMVGVLEKGVYMDDLFRMSREANKRSEIFNIIESRNAITVITCEDFFDDIKKSFKSKTISLEKGLILVILKSPKEIQEVSGVVSYLFSLLGENDINIKQLMSCWTDTLFVVEEGDLARVVELLKF